MQKEEDLLSTKGMKTNVACCFVIEDAIDLVDELESSLKNTKAWRACREQGEASAKEIMSRLRIHVEQ